MIIEQIIHSLERLIQVKKVIDLTPDNATNERELALIKIFLRNNNSVLLKKLIKKYKAKLIFNNSRKYAFEMWGDQLDQLYHDIESGKFGEAAKSGDWYVGITSIKNAYPKPS